MKINTFNSEHYTWGSNCDGWHLLNSDSLSVIQERMPAGTEEQRHYHVRAQQVFYILSGTAVFECENEAVEVNAMEAFHIKPNTIHKIKNCSLHDLIFLVISEPKAHGDRVNV